MKKKHIDDKGKVLAELAELRYKKGYSRLSMVSWLKENYNLEKARAYDYIREMLAASAEAYHKLNEDALADSISFLEEMKQKAVGQGNDKLALEWAKELHKVSQLYVERLEIEAKNITINIKKNED